MKNSSTTTAAEAHGWDYNELCVFDSTCASLSDLNVGPVGCVSSVGVCLHAGGVGVCLGFGA